MLMGKARSQPKSGAPERSFVAVGSSFTHKHSIRPEMLAGTFAHYSH